MTTPPSPPIPPSGSSAPGLNIPSSAASPASTASTASTTTKSAAAVAPTKLTGFRTAFQHTGIPVSVLTWKPRLPSRNWTIFLTLVGTLTYLYVDDRRQCKRIRQEYIDKVKGLADEVLEGGSLGQVRKVKVYGARWPEDEDDDRALRYFRKYVKPYLVAAAVDFEQVTAPLHGSITRQVRASILSKRRQRLGLEPTPLPLSLPGALDPESIEKREVESGIILVGRPSMKEYLRGLELGWGKGVGEWEWEKEVENGLNMDVFSSKEDVIVDTPSSVPEVENSTAKIDVTQSTATSSQPTSGPTPNIGLSFLTRPLSTPVASNPLNTCSIPAEYHVPPSPLPPHPPILLLPFTNHLGFKQLPQIVYSFFTERHRVLSGAQSAYALITSTTRPFEGPLSSTSTSTSTSTTSPSPSTGASEFSDSTSTSKSSVNDNDNNNNTGDLAFDIQAERYYKSSFKDLPDRIDKSRKEYYAKLPERIEFARQYVRGEREMTPEETKRGKVTTEDDLKEERRKKELRWTGMIEGWDIVRPETPVAWDERWRGWLKVYDVEGVDKKSDF